MGYELINEIGAKSALLDKAIGQLGARGRAYAQAESAREAIQGYKLQIRILDAQLEREWARASRD